MAPIMSLAGLPESASRSLNCLPHLVLYKVTMAGM